MLIAVGLFAASLMTSASPAISESLRLDLETGLSGADYWAGRKRHPATVNGVCETTRPDLISLRGEWDFTNKNHASGCRTWYCSLPSFWEKSRKISVPSTWEAQGMGEEGVGTCHTHHDSSPKPLRHHYVGEGWYRKLVTIPESWAGKRVWLKIGGVRSKGWFFVCGRAVAMVDVYGGAWKYDVTDCVKPGKCISVIACVDNLEASRNGEPSSVNRWGGLVRDVELEATPMTCIDDAWVRGDFDKRLAQVKVLVDGAEKDEKLSVRATIENEKVELPISASAANLSLELPLRNFRPWSPEHPNLYTAKVELVSADGKVLQSRLERFGVRKLEVRGTRFYLNDKPFFFRGFGDDSVYPITGFSPASREYHLQHLCRAHECGFNYSRLHTHCETPEYFEAADEAGIIVQAELSYYMDACDDSFDYSPFKDAEERWIAFRRYPSWGISSSGNEGSLGGDANAGKRMYSFLKRIDPDRLVIEEDGPRNTLMEEEKRIGDSDFIGGPLNVWRRGSYAPDRPFVCHEYMNLSVKQDSRLESQFSGIWLPPETRARRAERLAAAGLTHEWGDRLQNAQHALQATFQKLGLECARCDPYCAGYCYWTIADATVLNTKLDVYTAQGLFDAFWNQKECGNSIADFATFNSPSCLLLNMDHGTPTNDITKVDHKWWIPGVHVDTNRVFVAGNELPLEFMLAHYGEAPLTDARLEWKLTTSEGAQLANGVQPLGTCNAGVVRSILTTSIVIPDVAHPVKAVLSASIRSASESVSNHWDFYVFPKREVREVKGLACASEFLPQLGRRYRGLLPASAEEKRVVIVREGSVDEVSAKASRANIITLTNQDGAPNFKLGWWWIGNQVGTAILKHPALAEFPYEPYMNQLFFRIIKTGTPLDKTTDERSLIIAGEGGKEFFRYLTEETLPSGAKLIRISGLDVLSDTPEGAALLDSIITYLN